MPTTTTVSDDFVVGSMHTFQMVHKRTGVITDITGFTITFTLADPDDNEADYTATVTDGPNGEASYTIATSVLDEKGNWKRKWKVEGGGLTFISEWIPFYVNP